MTRGRKKFLTSKPFLSFLYRFIRLYSSTFRLKVENEREWMEYRKQGGRVLLCAWHQQFFSAIRHFQGYRKFNPSLMISGSSDGEIIAGVAGRSGWNPVRGSSSKGGKEALRRMIECLWKSGVAGHIVDGPKGPAGQVKAGVIRLANAADAAIFPFYAFADRAWYFNSWDRFFLPKPFATVVLSFGKMIKFTPADDPNRFESYRLHLEQTMIPELRVPHQRIGEIEKIKSLPVISSIL